ncbi:iron-sulfur cluster assembly protein [Roseibium sp. RKSG952]|uniref:iron-sulfur cluster assembly protein n=1 Tax=Roseibium sp. RKSG952 TaxID=2529384 RepID=UPI0012BB5979|nr:iron-sulfur cluster assembly protein [Roseibium sp. RKSG952]
MFLVLKDEQELGGSPERYDPGLVASPFNDAAQYEARSAGTADGQAPAPLDVAEAITDVFDPEIPTDVYNLGLIYDINVSENGDVGILMTLTAPNCPAAGILPGEVAEAAARTKGAANVGVNITFDVPWNPDMMSEIGRVALGIY